MPSIMGSYTLRLRSFISSERYGAGLLDITGDKNMLTFLSASRFKENYECNSWKTVSGLNSHGPSITFNFSVKYFSVVFFMAASLLSV